MEYDKIIEVCNKLSYIIQTKYPLTRPKRQDLNIEEVSASHLLWMCEEIPVLLQEQKTEKAHRWLGFIQGAVACKWNISIQQMKDMNKPQGD